MANVFTVDFKLQIYSMPAVGKTRREKFFLEPGRIIKNTEYKINEGATVLEFLRILAHGVLHSVISTISKVNCALWHDIKRL